MAGLGDCGLLASARRGGKKMCDGIGYLSAGYHHVEQRVELVDHRLARVQLRIDLLEAANIVGQGPLWRRSGPTAWTHLYGLLHQVRKSCHSVLQSVQILQVEHTEILYESTVMGIIHQRESFLKGLGAGADPC